jgi:hypothetical protein
MQEAAPYLLHRNASPATESGWLLAMQRFIAKA